MKKTIFLLFSFFTFQFTPLECPVQKQVNGICGKIQFFCMVYNAPCKILMGFTPLFAQISQKTEDLDTLFPHNLTLTFSRFKDVSSYSIDLTSSNKDPKLTALQIRKLTYSLRTSENENRNQTLLRSQINRTLSLSIIYPYSSYFNILFDGDGGFLSDKGIGYHNKTNRSNTRLGVNLSPYKFLSIKKSFGITQERYLSQTASPRDNRGRNEDLNVSLTPTSSFPLSILYTDQLSSQSLIPTRDILLQTKLERKFLNANNIILEAQGTRSRTSYPLQTSSEEKALLGERYIFSLSSAFGKNPSPPFEFFLRVSHSFEKTNYNSPDTLLNSSAKDKTYLERLFSSSFTYNISQENRLSFSFNSGWTENLYRRTYNDQTLKTRGIKLTLTRKKDTSQIELRQFLSLDSYDFLHPFNFNTRDFYNSETSLSFYLQLTDITKISTLFNVRQTHLVYLRQESSANNRWQKRYTVVPGLQFRIKRGILFTQEYILYADYTIYDFIQSNNFLLRSITVDNSLKFIDEYEKNSLILSLWLNDQDQGSYIYDNNLKKLAYTAETEIKRQHFGISSSHTFHSKNKVSFGYLLIRRQDWKYIPDSTYTRLLKTEIGKTLQHDFSLSLQSNLSTKSSLSASITRSLRTEPESPYWNIQSSINTKF